MATLTLSPFPLSSALFKLERKPSGRGKFAKVLKIEQTKPICLLSDLLDEIDPLFQGESE